MKTKWVWLIGAAVLPVFLLCGPVPNYRPDAPAIPAGPASGRAGTPYFFSTQSFDRQGDSICYQFYWGDGTKSNWSGFVPSGTKDSTAKSWSAPGRYLILSRAKDRKGEVSDSSDPWPIAVVQTLPNRPPLAPPPPDGPSRGLKDSACAFTTSTTDPDADSISCRFDWGDGSQSYWTGFVPSGAVVAGQYSWPAAGTYLVKSMARDPVGLVSDWSEPHQIVISDSAKLNR
jgi:hypothetical protein